MKMLHLKNTLLSCVMVLCWLVLLPIALPSQSWEEVLNGDWFSSFRYPVIKMLDAQRGWLLTPDALNESIDRLYQTADGGDTWAVILETPPNTPFDDLCCMEALDTNRVWIGVDRGQILRTTNGGQSWESTTLPLPPEGNFWLIRQIQFDTPDRGWVRVIENFSPTYNDRIFYTLDGGQSWTTLLDLNAFEIAMGWPTHPYILTQVFSNDELMLAFLNRDGGNSSGLAQYALLRSTDSGQSWNYHGQGIPRVNSQAIVQQVNDSLILIPGSNNNARLHRSTDQGLSWSDVPRQESDINSSLSYLYCGFINDTVGWMTRNISGMGSRLSFTSDGGHTFFDQRLDDLGMSSYQVVNDSLVFAGGAFKILRYRGQQASCGSVLLHPAPGELSSLLPLLRWSRSPGCVDGYRLRLSLSADLASPFLDMRLGWDTTYQLVSPLPEGVQVYVDILPFNYQFGEAPSCNLRYSFWTANCPAPTLLEATVCVGDSLALAEDLTVAQAGVYERLYTSTYGCDSLVVWSVAEAPQPITGILIPLCSGDTLHWQDTTITAGGLYEFHYLSAAGCDSLVRLNVSERPPIHTVIDTAIIAGQAWGGVVYTADTSLVYVLTAANGCDSLVTVNLMLITAIGEPPSPIGGLSGGVFPNPGNAQEARLWVRIPASCRLEAALYDVSGQSLLSWAVAAPQGASVWPLPANLAHLPPGVYFITLSAPEGRLTLQWVKG